MKKTTRIALFNDHPQTSDIEMEVLEGLSVRQKTLPAKYFYDERGSQLFECITQLPEYYPTRTEISLLKQYARDLAAILGDNITLLEYGSGASIKIRLLLDALRPACYVPMDISKDFLMASSRQLAQDYPWLNIHAACVDYSQSFQLPSELVQSPKRRVGFFPGSSIGNFTPKEAISFLNRAHKTLGIGQYLLVGVDMMKSSRILKQAYDDAQGVTALFNKNILRHINKLLNGNFNEDHFEHHIHVCTTHNRVEMHLKSKIDQVVHIGNKTIGLKNGETIHTENSYKYTPQSFASVAQEAGFSVHSKWHDHQGLFGLFLLQAEPTNKF